MDAQLIYLNVHNDGTWMYIYSFLLDFTLILHYNYRYGWIRIRTYLEVNVKSAIVTYRMDYLPLGNTQQHLKTTTKCVNFDKYNLIINILRFNIFTLYTILYIHIINYT